MSCGGRAVGLHIQALPVELQLLSVRRSIAKILATPAGRSQRPSITSKDILRSIYAFLKSP